MPVKWNRPAFWFRFYEGKISSALLRAFVPAPKRWFGEVPGRRDRARSSLKIEERGSNPTFGAAFTAGVRMHLSRTGPGTAMVLSVIALVLLAVALA
jgi:hypothetical protein